MCPYAIMIGEKHTYFTAKQYNFIEKDNFEVETLLSSLNPFVYHVEKCGIDSFKKLERSIIHTFWPGVGEDQNQDQDQNEDEDEDEDHETETNYCNGNNEVVKIFNQMCVICLERNSDYAFRQCGHQCICE